MMLCLIVMFLPRNNGPANCGLKPRVKVHLLILLLVDIGLVGSNFSSFPPFFKLFLSSICHSDKKSNTEEKRRHHLYLPANILKEGGV
jgi:hypothetical protein